jgi:hypothetical protein
MAPATGPAGGTHGFDPVSHTCPTLALPFGIPFTDQVTVASDVLATIAAKDIRWPVATVAVGGATFTVTLLVMVAVAASVLAPLVTELAVAWIVTGFVAGRPAGAV